MVGQDSLSVPLQSHQDFLWTAQIQIGTPPLNYTVAVDTGSADMWLDASIFNTSASSTLDKTHQAFTIRYDMGEVSGYIASDHVSLQGRKVENQTFGIATNISDANIPQGVQGVMGMAGQRLSRLQATPFWQNLPLNRSIFSIYLKSMNQSGISAVPSDGILSLGTMNESMIAGPFNNLATVNPDTWSVPFSGINVSNHIVQVPFNTNAVIDSGTIMVGGPRNAIEEFYSQFDGASEIRGEPGFFSFQCASVPQVYLAFGNAQYKLKPADLILSEAQYAPDDRDGQPDSDDFKCVGSFFAMDAGTSWIVGGSFLKNVYTVFNNEMPRQIGFAPLNAKTFESEVLPVGLPSNARLLSPSHWILACFVAALYIFRS
ncbi:cathepsin D [Malassezia equina]|uniref:Cathepsin D n=1 Tax=Malassezia equina TaxID=1381935 RepID=A0AAF0E9A4_9BASI|nr:cathepsin D [Malassezia equina]